jgi:hypothetical protein
MDFSIVTAWKDLGDPDRRASYEWTRSYWRHHFPDAELVEGSPEPFTRARGLNDAIRRASHDVIFHADPDTVIAPASVRLAVEMVTKADGLVVPYMQYLYLTRDATRRLHAHGDWTEFDTGDCEFSGEGGAGPTSAFSRRTWELAGGYDERFGLWGGEDAAFAYACGAFVGPWRLIAGPALHSWHPRLPESIPGTDGYAKQFSLLAEYRDANERGPKAVRALVESR